MTRKIYLISFLAVCAVAVVVGRSVAEGSADAATLAERIRTQSEATRAALALAGDVWVPRIAGLGVGLSVGLVAGGATAYLSWGGGR